MDYYSTGKKLLWPSFFLRILVASTILVMSFNLKLLPWHIKSSHSSPVESMRNFLKQNYKRQPNWKLYYRRMENVESCYYFYY